MHEQNRKCVMVATHPYIQNPAKNGYFDMAFQPFQPKRKFYCKANLNIKRFIYQIRQGDHNNSKDNACMSLLKLEGMHITVNVHYSMYKGYKLNLFKS